MSAVVLRGAAISAINLEAEHIPQHPDLPPAEVTIRCTVAEARAMAGLFLAAPLRVTAEEDAK